MLLNELRDGVMDLVPETVVVALAGPYLAGTKSEAAINLAHQQFKQNRFTATLDILGEDSTSSEQCDSAVHVFKRVLDEVHARPLPTAVAREQITVSFKPSTFSTTVEGRRSSQLDEAYARIESVVDHAYRLGINMTIEAEDHRWTDFQQETYFALVKKGYSNLGTVLQSRLLRTADDVRKFDDKTRVRLVIGIYNEPRQIALVEKRTMKERLVEYGSYLAQRGTYVEFATHDLRCIDEFIKCVVLPLGLSRQNFEFQFLKGVPRAKLQVGLLSGTHFLELRKIMTGQRAAGVSTLSDTGAIVRLYLPFGPPESAGSYCKRRLKENPSIVGYGLKNLLRLQ